MLTSVLIADDESLARDGLRTLVASLDGFRVVAVAHDGDDAVAKARSASPDICILDVRMPGRDGLEALEAIRQVHPGVRCIIYSGHDDFRYAQTAIKLKADDYVLKPASRDALEDSLRRVRRDALAAPGSAASGTALERRLAAGLDAVEEIFYRNLLSGDVSLEGIVDHRDVLETACDPARVLILSLDDAHQIRLTRGEEAWHALRGRLRAIAHDVCSRTLSARAPLLSVGGDPVLILGARSAADSFPRYLRHEAQVALGHDVTVAVGDEVALERLAQSYESARRRLAYRLSLGGRRVTGPDDDPVAATERVRMPAESIVRIRKSVRYADRAAVDEEITGLISYFRTHVPHPESWRRFCFQVYEECHFNVRECVPDPDLHLTPIELSQTLCDVSTAPELERWLRSSLGRLMDTLDNSCRSYSLPLKKALDYIDRNFATEFSLRDLADYVQLNPSYLSSLISRESGKTFVEHVTERRMGRARELLAGGTHNVSEVAYELGYETPRYFSMVFKKWTGMTPSAYQHAADAGVPAKET